MAFQVSPRVQVRELDLTNVVPAVSTSIGGYAGAFNWGPVEEIRTVTSEKELASVFGSPTAGTARSFLTAASFLAYGNNLKVVRAVKSTALNATSGFEGNSGLLIKNLDSYESAGLAAGNNSRGPWAARCPGALGNSISVSVCPSADAFADWDYKNLFTSAPGTSDSAASAGSSNDEIHVVVVDNLGQITGTPGTVLETFAFLSMAVDALNANGTSNYYQTVVNNTSKYLFWLDHDEAMTDAGGSIYSESNFSAGSSVLDYTLTNGTADVDTLPTTGDVQSALDLFADAETVDVNFLFTAGDAAASSGVSDVAMANYITAICEARKDCMAFVSPPLEYSTATSTPATDVSEWSDGLTHSSYTVIDSGAVKVYDKYNDVYRWITAAGHVAGLCANTDLVADSWFSPAGTTRGLLRNVVKLAYNPNQADRDTLYKKGVNPLVSFPGQGPVLYGDKTALSKPSAFDRINVRRLFITLEKSIATAARAQLFEFNDEFTRAMFRNMVEPFLRDVQGRRGVTNFLVICDSTNNTGDVIDRNEFRADIYVKPNRSINFITLNFIATRTNVSFSEIVGTGSTATPNL